MGLTKQWVSALGAVLLALSAVSVQAETPKQGGTLVWSIGTTPRHLNPAVQSGIATGAPGAQLTTNGLRTLILPNHGRLLPMD